MAYVMQQVCDRARLSLNDAGKVRYPDATLLAHANDGVKMIRQKRPDYFIANLNIAMGEAALADVLAGDDEVFTHVVAYTIGMASAADAEHVVTGRVAAFLQKFERDLGGM